MKSTVTSSFARARGRQQAHRLLKAASDLTKRTIVGKIVQAGTRTLLLIGVVDEDLEEAQRIHHALIDVSVREKFDVDVIVVAGKE